MLRILILTFTAANLAWLTGCQEQQPASRTDRLPASPADSIPLSADSASPFLMKYQGYLTDQMPVELVLINWGDGFMSGRYSRQGENKQYALAGELSSNLTFKVTSYDGQLETGILSGVLTDTDTLRGLFTSLPSQDRQAFELLSSRPEDPVLSAWQGNWHLDEIWDHGVLMIGNASADSLDFALTFARNSHTGTIEGRAALSGNKAFFSKAEFEVQPCQLMFHLAAGKHIVLEQSSSNFECGFGAGAFAGGIYMRQKTNRKATLPVGTSESSVFPTKELHDRFSALTGESLYASFAFNMRQVALKKTAGDRTLVSGSVPGLERSNEAIIMFDKNGTIWAATLFQEEGNPNISLLYVTNDSAAPKRIPPDFQFWMEGFADYPIVYQAIPGSL
jgi:hypothetical protein